MDILDQDVILSILYCCTGTTYGAPICDAVNMPPFQESYVPKESALRQACLLSQVCTSWRHILLNTPAFWGRLIDLDAIRFDYGCSIACFEEIIRRSGNAPLFIYGRVLIPPKRISDRHIGERLLRLMDMEWHRIQLLSLKFDDNHRKNILSLALATFVQRPAPILHHFALNVFLENVRHPEYWTLRFFADDAPSLKHFHYQGLGFPVETPWLAGLHTLSLAHMPHMDGRAMHFSLKLSNLKATLDCAGRLRNLDIVDCFNDWSPLSPIDIPLPTSLQSLAIRDELNDCIMLLRSLHADHALSNFSVVVRPKRWDPYSSPTLFIELLEHLFTHLQRSLAVQALRGLHLEFMEGTFDFSAKFPGSLFQAKGGYNAWLGTTLSLKGWGLFPHLSAVGIFSSVNHLSLNVPNGIIDQSIIPAFEALKQLTTLQISCLNLASINHWVRSRDSKSVLLPSLRNLTPTLNMEYNGPGAAENRKSVPDTLTSFLSWRIEQGVPLECVDLGKITRWVWTYGNASYLRKFDSLKVKWTNLERDDGEFICGQSADANSEELSLLGLNAQSATPSDGSGTTPSSGEVETESLLDNIFT